MKLDMPQIQLHAPEWGGHDGELLSPMGAFGRSGAPGVMCQSEPSGRSPCCPSIVGCSRS